jgi:hypothetical protein
MNTEILERPDVNNTPNEMETCHSCTVDCWVKNVSEVIMNL